jgi:DNA polymerase III subunit delta'
MNWNNVIAQHTIKNHLQDMVSHNRLSHALLFLGKEGNGALPLAIEFAKNIICQPKAAPIVEDLFGGLSAIPTTNEDIAAARHRADELIHPDLHFSFPVISERPSHKPICNDFINRFREFIKIQPYCNVFDWLQYLGVENKQGNITAEECNDIIKKLSLKSYESEYKILIMWMPEYLGKEGNKLLKLIEEPPPNTLFILVAENEENILPTIISRCQVVRIPILQVADVEQALIERNQTDPIVARQIASVCEGNYREALQLLQHNEEDWLTLLKNWLNVMFTRNIGGQLAFIDEANKLGREKQKQLLRYFNHLIEQSVKVKILGEENIIVPANELDFTKRLNKQAGINQLKAVIEELDKAVYYIERNANAKMLFQALTIKLFHIIKNQVVVEM